MAQEKKLPKPTGGKLQISEVRAAPPGPEGPAWARVLKAFNPFGPISEMYAQTLAYRLESKRLAVELERVRSQKDIAIKVIDDSFRLKIEELEQRRLAINRYFDTVQQQLDHLHVERMAVLAMIQHAMSKTTEPGLPIEERRLFKELTAEMTSTLPQFGQAANESLRTLIQALPPVAMPPGLLLE